MMMLTKEIRKRIPKIGTQDGLGGDAIIHVKFFTPWSNWTWYALEGEPVLDKDGKEVDFIFFGFVEGLEKEYGSFTLNELCSVRGPVGLRIERDRYFGPQPLSTIKGA
jgi:hypothetical protein